MQVLLQLLKCLGFILHYSSGFLVTAHIYLGPLKTLCGKPSEPSSLCSTGFPFPAPKGRVGRFLSRRRVPRAVLPAIWQFIAYTGPWQAGLGLSRRDERPGKHHGARRNLPEHDGWLESRLPWAVGALALLSQGPDGLSREASVLLQYGMTSRSVKSKIIVIKT